MHLSGYRNLLSRLVLVLLESAAAVSVAAVEFDHKVAPLLVRHCLECHNGFDLKGKLDLSQREAAMKGGKQETSWDVSYCVSNSPVGWEG